MHFDISPCRVSQIQPKVKRNYRKRQKKDSQKSDIKDTKQDTQPLKQTCSDMENSIDGYKYREETTDKLSDIEAMSMKENLIFYGILEQPAPIEGQQLQYENCDTIVKDLIQKALEINTENMRCDRFHR